MHGLGKGLGTSYSVGAEVEGESESSGTAHAATENLGSSSSEDSRCFSVGESQLTGSGGGGISYDGGVLNDMLSYSLSFSEICFLRLGGVS